MFAVIESMLRHSITFTATGYPNAFVIEGIHLVLCWREIIAVALA